MLPGENLVLVDGSSLAFRSFFALFKSGLRRADGTPTWAIYGFFNSLFDFIERKRPDGLAMCFDLAGPTFRHEEFAEYKANRSQMPDDLSQQWPVIKQGVKLLGMPIYEVAGFEADDVIGTVARMAEAKGILVQIFTGDKDAFQLVDNESRAIRVLMPGRPGKGEILEFGRQEVFEKLGVYPEQVIDYKGLCGDNSDNIPGVKGIGPVTAVQLLTEYKTVEGIYEHLEQIKSKSVKQKLIDGKESAFASKKLATMRLDVPLEFDFEHCQLNMPSVEALSQFFTELEFKSLVSRLNKILPRFNPKGDSTPQVTSSSGQIVDGRPDFSVRFEKPGTEKSPVRTGSSSTATLVAPKIEIAAFTEPFLVKSEEQLATLVSELGQQSSFCLELETSTSSSLDSEVLGYAFAWAEGLVLTDEGGLTFGEKYSAGNWQVQTAYIPISITGGLESDSLPQDTVIKALLPLLVNEKIGKILQNCKFKLNALSVLGIEVKPIAFDPILASYIVNPDEKHLLKDQAERLLGYATVRASESAGLNRKQLTISFASLDKVASCAADDARIALELTRYYLQRLDNDQRYLLYEMELPLALVLARMEQNGIALDLPYLAALSVELNGELTRLEKEIYELAGHSFNISSNQQLQKILFDELGLKTKGTTKTGFSTDASVLDALKDEHKIIPLISEYRQLSKLRSTYVDSLPPQVSGRTGRLHGEFNQTTTATGRLSSSNPNLQNIPIKTEFGRRIRRAFVAGIPGSSILSADYSQIELRLLAHMSGDETLIDAFEKDQDIHARTAGEVFDIPFDQVTSDMRRVGKTLNFALIYQQGPYATAQDLGISTKEAQTFIDKYFARYPKVRGFLTRTIEDARKNNFVSTLWGRKRHFRFLNDRSDPVRKADERAACNAPLQGSAADLMKLAMIRLDKELQQRGTKAKLILQVHDELVLEVPEDELEIVKGAVRSAMQMDQPLKAPLKVDVGCALNWMDAK
jgi:DNA polymerase I